MCLRLRLGPSIAFAIVCFDHRVVCFFRPSVGKSVRPASSEVSLVGPSGLEPPTSRLSGVRSNLLSYGPVLGGDEENRTPDPLLA